MTLCWFTSTHAQRKSATSPILPTVAMRLYHPRIPSVMCCPFRTFQFAMMYHILAHPPHVGYDEWYATWVPGRPTPDPRPETGSGGGGRCAPFDYGYPFSSRP